MSETSFEVLIERITNVEKQVDRHLEQAHDDIESLSKRISKLETTKEKTDYQFNQIMDSLKKLTDTTIPKLTNQIEELKNKPVKRYDQAISSIIGAVFGAVGALIASMLINSL